MKHVKHLKIILLTVVFLLSACGRFRKIPLISRINFSLPINAKNNGIKILKSSGPVFEIPSLYQVNDNNLYIIDKFNNRMLKYNKKNSLILAISNTKKNKVRLVYTGSNQVLRPLHISKKLFSFHELGALWVNKENIYLESILKEKNEESKIKGRSLILKFDKDGAPLDIIGTRIKRSNQIIPFPNMVKFTVDQSNNLFAYLQNDDHTQVLKLNEDHKIIYRFNSSVFFQKNKIKPDKKTKENIIIDNIDNSYAGNFLVLTLTYFKDEIKFQKTVFYKVDISTGNSSELFIINNENYNFILIDNSNLVYLWETENIKKNKENIILRLYNIDGRSVINYTMKLNRDKEQWFDIKIQKDKKITGINIKDNKYNVAMWK